MERKKSFDAKYEYCYTRGNRYTRLHGETSATGVKKKIENDMKTVRAYTRKDSYNPFFTQVCIRTENKPEMLNALKYLEENGLMYEPAKEEIKRVLML